MKIRILNGYLVAVSFCLIHYYGWGQSAAEEDRKLGEKVAKQVETTIGIYKAPKTTGYVSQVGDRLVSNLHSEFSQFSFQIVDQFEPNAFAAPGGFIYVSRGLLVLLDSEAELAGVLGHEISHVTQRHAYQRKKKGVFSSIIKIPGNIVGSVLGEGLGNVLNAPWDALSANYSRKQESEADEYGLKLAADTGYDPGELADILARMQAEIEALTQEQIRFSFFDSHPSTPKRIENIQKQTAQLQVDSDDPIATDRGAFLENLDGLHFDVDPANGVFQRNKFLHPDLNLSLTFPEGWKTINTPLMSGSLTENGDGFILLGLEDQELDPVETGKKLEWEFRKRGVDPLESGPIKTDYWNGYLLAFGEYTKSGPTVTSMILLTMEGRNYKILANGTDQYQGLIEKATYSFKPITPEERKSIISRRLRIVEARQGETLEDLSERSGNAWEVSFTALVNNIPADETLQKGHLIKIIKEEPYAVNEQ